VEFDATAVVPPLPRPVLPPAALLGELPNPVVPALVTFARSPPVFASFGPSSLVLDEPLQPKQNVRSRLETQKVVRLVMVKW
jgi:hypothetical protein